MARLLVFQANLYYNPNSKGSFINYVTQLGGGGYHLCYAMVQRVSKWVFLAFWRGGGGVQILAKMVLRNI